MGPDDFPCIIDDNDLIEDLVAGIQEMFADLPEEMSWESLIEHAHGHMADYFGDCYHYEGDMSHIAAEDFEPLSELAPEALVLPLIARLAPAFPASRQAWAWAAAEWAADHEEWPLLSRIYGHQPAALSLAQLLELQARKGWDEQTQPEPLRACQRSLHMETLAASPSSSIRSRSRPRS